MARIPLITSREGLEGEQQAAFDVIVESRGQMLRPFEVLLHTPGLAIHAGALGAEIRFESELADRDRELLILTAATEHGCAFEWDTHLDVAAAAGVSEEAIAVLRNESAQPDEREEVLIAFARQLCRTSAVTDDMFATTHKLLGTSGIVEAATTVGYYTMLAYTMNSCGAC